MKKHATLLTRKLGPLPFWAWAVVAGGVIYWYRNRQASSSSSGVLGYTGPLPGPQGPPGPTGPPGAKPTPGSPGGRKHHPKPRRKKKKPHHKKRRGHEQHRSGRHTDHGHGDAKARHHHTGAQHEHRARRKKIIPRHTRQAVHSGVHHDLHGTRQARNEPHTRSATSHAAMVAATKHSARNARPRAAGIRAALTSVSPIPRGTGRPRVGASLTAEGRNHSGGLAHVAHPAPAAVSRNRIIEPPSQGHVRRQANPSRAARPIVLRGGRNPQHAEAPRQVHATQKQIGQATTRGKRERRRAV